MYKKAKIIFFCTVFVAANAFSQNHELKPGKLVLFPAINQTAISSPNLIKTNPNTPFIKSIIAPDLYFSQLGYFCKQEIKFEKATKVPFKFRLGSVEDCDRMEGKNKATTRHGGEQNAVDYRR